MEVYINADLFCENTNFLITFPSCVIVFLHFVFQLMVATFRCDQIAKETLSRLNSDKVCISFLYFFLQKLLRYLYLKISLLVIQLISHRIGWHWEKMLKLVQHPSLGKISYLFWKALSPSKSTSCSLFWKAIRSACLCSIRCRIKMLQSTKRHKILR